MAGDFNKPANSSTRANFMQEIRDMFTDMAKMFSGTSTTNYPTGAIRYNSTTHLLEKYNGATWDVLDVSGLTIALANTLLANGAARSATSLPGANNVPVLDANGDLNMTVGGGKLLLGNDKAVYQNDAGASSRRILTTISNSRYFGDIDRISTGHVYLSGATENALHFVTQGNADRTVWHSGNAIIGEQYATSTSATTQINLGTVTSGDVIFIQAQGSVTNSSTAGLFSVSIAKTGGSAATVRFAGGSYASLSQSFYVPASQAAQATVSGYIMVTGSGSLLLETSLGIQAGATRNANEISAIFMKKQ